MTRNEIIQFLDGTHPSGRRGIAMAHQGLIMLSAISIGLETMPNLQPWAIRTLYTFEVIVLVIFAAEYVTRIVCAKQPMRYVFSFWGIIDLLSCLPLLAVIQTQWAALRTLRLLRLVRVLKLLHSNRALARLERALYDSRGELAVFAMLACIILYIAAVGIYVFEHEAQPEAFSSVPVSLWWAVVSFTTVGYGDIYPITVEGRLFTACILFVGLGVIAVPTAIITTALINTRLRNQMEEEFEQDLRKDLRREAEAKRRHSRKKE